MEMREYLDILSEQIRCKKARPMIVEEMRQHIEDQAEAYRAEGAGFEEALEQAVREMGDPVETGVALDRVHRPKMQWKMMILAVVLSLIGMTVQIIIFKEGAMSGTAEVSAITNTYIIKAIANTLLSLVIIIGVCAIDYTFLAKHPIALWLGIGLLLTVYYFLYGYRMMMRNAAAYYAMTLAVPAYAAILFHYRGKGLKGLVKALLLLVLMGAALLINSAPMSGLVEMSAAVLLILTISVLKGWFGEKKAGKLALFWVPALGIPLSVIADAYWNQGKLRLLAAYQAERIRAMFDQSTYAAGYRAVTIQEELNGMTLFGSRQLPLTTLPSIQNDYVVTSMFTYFGAVFTLLVLCAVCYFIYGAFHISIRQKNQLGFLVSISCCSLLLIKTLSYLISNLGLCSVFTPMSMPFLSYGTGNALVNGVLVGLLLSVYRNTNIVSEKNIRASYVFRLPIQKV